MGGERQKRRFVHDGEVPVVVLAGSMSASSAAGAHATNRLAAAESALDAERAARKRVERALGEAQAQVHDLQTKIGHAELARNEALDAVQELRNETQRLGESLDAERRARAEAEQALRTALDRREYAALRRAAAPPVVRAEPGPPEPRKRARFAGSQERPRTPRVKEPKPVKWW